MKTCVLVTGGRDYQNREKVSETLDAIDPSFLVEGGATGADALARAWADARGIHCATIPALWTKFGRSAGPIRNAVMVSIVKAFEATGTEVTVVAFPGGTGTSNCVTLASEQGLTVKRIRE